MGEPLTVQAPVEHTLSTVSRVYVTVTALLGFGVAVAAGANWPHADWLRFVFFAVVTGLASGWKVRFPGVEATLSMSFFFSLLAAVELGFSEAVAVAGISGIIQSYWRPSKRPEPIQIPFNVSVLALSSGAAALAFNCAWGRRMGLDILPRIALAAGAQFCANSLLVSGIIVLTQKTKLRETFSRMFWSGAYYYAGALAAGFFHYLSNYSGWQSALLFIPAAHLVYRSIVLYLDRLDAQRQHASQISDLQLRTIEALALAIECKDETTHEHLGRVQVYAMEVGLELGLQPDEMEALRAASSSTTSASSPSRNRSSTSPAASLPMNSTK